MKRTSHILPILTLIATVGILSFTNTQSEAKSYPEKIKPLSKRETVILDRIVECTKRTMKQTGEYESALVKCDRTPDRRYSRPTAEIGYDVHPDAQQQVYRPVRKGVRK